MEKFTLHTGVAVPLRRSNVDTDQIIPAEYLKRITRHGFEDGLFAAWRRDPGFVLNDAAYADATVLVAGPDFGTGSSREHAVWALQDYGFRVVVSSRFADIFRGNSGKGGLLTAVVPQDVVERIWSVLEAEPGTRSPSTSRRASCASGDVVAPFEIDDYVRWRLMEGLDDIGITLTHQAGISAFEATRPSHLPRTVVELTPGCDTTGVPARLSCENASDRVPFVPLPDAASGLCSRRHQPWSTSTRPSSSTGCPSGSRSARRRSPRSSRPSSTRSPRRSPRARRSPSPDSACSRRRSGLPAPAATR